MGFVIIAGLVIAFFVWLIWCFLAGVFEVLRTRETTVPARNDLWKLPGSGYGPCEDCEKLRAELEEVKALLAHTADRIEAMIEREEERGCAKQKAGLQ